MQQAAWPARAAWQGGCSGRRVANGVRAARELLAQFRPGMFKPLIAPRPPACLPLVCCRALAAPAALLMTVGQGAFRGLQDMKTPLAITLAANAINLALDIVLIMGLGWGVRGAATATTTAEWVAALAYLGVLYRRRDELGGLEPRLVLGSAVQEALEEMAPFLRAGGAMLMRTALLLGTKTLASATAARWAGRASQVRELCWVPDSKHRSWFPLLFFCCTMARHHNAPMFFLQAGRGAHRSAPGRDAALAALLADSRLGRDSWADAGGGAGAR